MSLLIFVCFLNSQKHSAYFFIQLQELQNQGTQFQNPGLQVGKNNDIHNLVRGTYIFLTLLFSSAMAFIKYKYREEQKEVENSQECKKNRLPTFL